MRGLKRSGGRFVDPLELDPADLTADTVRRVVVVVESEATRKALTRALSLDFSVFLTTPDELVPLVEKVRPHVVVLGERFSRTSGRQLALSLRATGPAFSIPVVGVLEGEVKVPSVLRWLSVGAVDVWQVPFSRDPAQRLVRLLAECDATELATETLVKRLLAFVRRVAISGTVVVYPDTPFEGRATFFEGALVDAALSDLTGEAALAQIIELDGQTPQWFDAQVQTAPMKNPLAGQGRPTRVLVIEDLETISHLVRTTLSHAGYLVDVAHDGEEGLERALAGGYDVVVVDLNLPVVDGWGVMRALQADVVARESAVLVLSAHFELVETLKAARAGARAWLKKSGRSKELLDAVGLVARPRQLAWQSLSAKERPSAIAFDVRAVGAGWLLRTLAELDCCGTLTIEDELTRVSLEVCHGQLGRVLGQVGSRQVRSVAALEVLLGSGGQGHFEPKPAWDLQPDAPWVFDAVEEAVRATRRALERRLAQAIAQPGQLYVNHELSGLFARFATRVQLEVLEATLKRPGSFDALAQSVTVSPEEVRAVLVELLRRGVLSTEPLEVEDGADA